MKSNIYKKNTLHLIYALSSGGGENIIKTFHKEGDSCISLTYNSCLEGIQEKSLPLRIISKSRYYSFFEYIKSIPSLIILIFYLLLFKKNYSLVFHGFPFQFLVFLFAINRKNKVYMVYHQFKKEPNSLKGFLSVNLEKIFLNLSSRTILVGVSPWVINYINKWFKPTNRCLLLRIPLKIKSNKKSLINIKNNGNYLIYGARLVRDKGHLRMLKDIYNMKISNPKIKTILLCGSGDNKIDILNYSKNLKQFNILIIDDLNHSEYLSLLKKSSGFLFPSFREAFPLSLLEAILLSKKTFIWENYLHKFYEDCSYKSNFLESFLRGQKLPLLPKFKKRKEELEIKYLKNKKFLECIKKEH